MTATTPDVGDLAPSFDLPRDGGDQVSSGALTGKPIVLFFYPRDNTSGCTKEAVAFSALNSEFEALRTVVLGVSKDSVASHDKFRDKHALTVPLLSDEADDVCERFGVWKEKKMYGRAFMGIERSTFLIGSDGRIAKVWRKVKVPGHAEAVLDAARAL